MQNFSFPHPTVCPSVETIFVDGVKFDICEFNTEDARKEFGIFDKRRRFILYVEDELFNLDLILKTAEDLSLNGLDCNKVWAWTAGAKSDMKYYINQFEESLNRLKRLEDKQIKYPKMFLKDQILKEKQYLMKFLPDVYDPAL